MKHIILFAFCLPLLFGCSSDIDSNPSYTTDFVGSGYNSSGVSAGPVSAEKYNTIVENPFVEVATAATSTFSIDADGGSYANVRRFLSANTKPVVDAIRTEELVNYFPLNYDDPTTSEPIAVNGEVSTCPWDPAHKLIRIGVKGRSIARENLLPSNIVLLIDVSGSMSSTDKLSLLKESLPGFVDNLRSQDKVAIVTTPGRKTWLYPRRVERRKAGSRALLPNWALVAARPVPKASLRRTRSPKPTLCRGVTTG